MVDWMLGRVICHEFDRVAGQNQGKTGKAMHVGFGMRCGNTDDQYDVIHMYIYAPHNYVYVVVQQERIDEAGERHVGQMEILSYHDSCWRDAIQTWICKHRDDINVFSSFKLSYWNDVVELTEEERKYLRDAEKWRSNIGWKIDKAFAEPNPFDKRGFWVRKS